MTNNAEKEQEIIKAGKGNLLDGVRKNIHQQMMPNFTVGMDEENKEFNEFMYEYIKELRGKDPFGLGKIIGFPQVMRTGITSTVFSFTVEGGKKYIFKTGLFGKNKNYIELEYLALNARRKTGVKTPIIEKLDYIDFNGRKIAYEVMEFVEVKEKRPNNMALYEELGETVSNMHKVKGEKFGVFEEKDGVLTGKSDTYICFPLAVDEAKKYLIDNGLIGDERLHKILDWTYITLNNDFQNGEKPTLIHRDIGKENFFLTTPITILDPNAFLGHPYEDIADYLLKVSRDDKASEERKLNVSNHFLKGYERGTGKLIDENLLDATKVVRSISKIYTTLKNGNHEDSARIKSLTKVLCDIAEKHNM